MKVILRALARVKGAPVYNGMIRKVIEDLPTPPRMGERVVVNKVAHKVHDVTYNDSLTKAVVYLGRIDFADADEAFQLRAEGWKTETDSDLWLDERP